MTAAETARLAQVWNDALLALVALQLDPAGLGGIWLQAGHGPVRDAWLASLHSSGLPVLKIPPQVDEERLLGGMDLAQTLQSGRVVQQSGLLAQAHGGVLLLPMAERLPPHTVAHIAQALDNRVVHSQSAAAPQPARFAAVALDESEADEGGLSARLSDRLALWLNLHDLTLAHTREGLEPLSTQERSEALALLPRIRPTEAQVQALCETAAALGMDSLRAPFMALRLAAVQAALEGRDALCDDDLAAGARLVLGPRATRMPQRAPEAAAEQTAPPPSEERNDAEPADATPPQDASAGAPTEQPADAASEPEPEPATESAPNPPPPDAAEPNADVLLAAALASLPPRLLDRLLLGQPSRATASGQGSSGLATRSKLRGRPLAPRPGKPGAGARLHVLATLRAAAPKQRLRHNPGGSKVQLRAEDFQVQRFAQRSPSCLIFALDASGSAALQRFAEAKGAVELLLQDSYARRDSVCVIAFRAASAQVLLPPTRSLVRAKRALAGLPGGGGTPLASGLRSALQQAQALQRAGSTPMLVMLSDGRANVNAAGVGGRASAQADALAWAAQWRNSGFGALWIDTAAQPEPLAQTLAQYMGAHYVPMPYVQAQRMAHVVQDLAAATRKG
jgi:magnesium chelatase subunit D